MLVPRALSLLLASVAVAFAQSTPNFYTINTLAGSIEPSGDGGQAKAALLLRPNGVITDRAANIYINDAGHSVIRKITPAGIISTVAGTFNSGGSRGDGGLATSAGLNGPTSVAVDSRGNLYIAEFARIRKVDENGIITTIAGTGQSTYSGDDGPALQAAIGAPQSIILDPQNNIIFSDRNNHVIRKIAPNGTITKVAGTGTAGFSGDGNQAALAQVNGPYGIALDAAGALYFVDRNNQRIRRIAPNGIITTLAGDGTAGFSGDNARAGLARISFAYAVAFDAAGNLYISDSNNRRVRRIDTAGIITTIAGNGLAYYTGENATATAAGFGSPTEITVDAAGNLLIADNVDNRIRRVNLSTRALDTVAGDFHSRGDNGPASAALLFNPTGTTLDSAGNLYFSDSDNQRVRRISPAGIIITVAGTGLAGNSGDGGQATAAQLQRPTGLAIDANGNLFIADTNNHRIRRVAPNGIITTFAGNGTSNTTGDGGLATAATLSFPGYLALDSAGNLFVASSNKIRKITAATGIITSVAGTGTAGYLGEGTPALNAQLRGPNGIAVDRTGVLYIADSGNAIIRKVETNGIISTFAGSPGNAGFSGDGSPANLARLSNPNAVAFDSGGNLYITDSGNLRIRRVATSGTITTIAGSGNGGFFGDGGLAIQASISNLGGISIRSDGTVYFVDTGNQRIRSLTPRLLSKLSIVNGANQSQPAGTRLQGPLVVAALDSTGAPVPGITVNFSIASGAATLSSPSALTGLDGNASVNLTLGAAAGPVSVTAVAPGVPSVSFSVTATEAVPLAPPSQTAYTISTIAGIVLPEDDIPATSVRLHSPNATAFDAAGNLFIADSNKHRVRKVTPDGLVTTLAGTGQPGFNGDGGPANVAQLNFPTAIAVDLLGNVFVVDRNNHLIRKVSPDGISSIVAGTGNAGFSGDGLPATSAQLRFPTGIAVDATGNLFIADANNFRIRKVTPDGIINSIAGNGRSGYGGDGGPATNALIRPTNIALDAAANLFITEASNFRVRRIDGSGIITTLAGNGIAGSSGDGGQATAASLRAPNGIAVDDTGNVYISDTNAYVIRMVAPNGVISTYAGNGSIGYFGDGGPAASASFVSPRGLSFDPAGNLYLAETSIDRIRRIDRATQTISTVAGASRLNGDGGPAAAAELYGPYNITTDASGNVYFNDTSNAVVRKIRTDGVINTIIGNGNYGPRGDGGPATAASFFVTTGLAVAGDGTIYVGDVSDHKVRKVSPDGTINAFAGNGTTGFSGDGAAATAAQLWNPQSLAVDTAGNVYISDFFTERIRVVTPDGIIKTIAGTEDFEYNGDGRQAVTASIDPLQVTFDSSGNLYLVDNFFNRIRRISPLGVITTVAGNGTNGFAGDGGPATSAHLNNPTGVAIDPAGNLYIADTGNARVRKVSPSGQIVTIAGGATGVGNGDGGPATAARLAGMSELAIDSAGNLYLTDRTNHVIRKLTPVTAEPAPAQTKPRQ